MAKDKYDAVGAGKWLRQERLRLCLTQREFALEMDPVKPPHMNSMYRWENGLARVPKRRCRQIAKVIGYDIETVGGILDLRTIPGILEVDRGEM